MYLSCHPNENLNYFIISSDIFFPHNSLKLMKCSIHNITFYIMKCNIHNITFYVKHKMFTRVIETFKICLPLFSKIVKSLQSEIFKTLTSPKTAWNRSKIGMNLLSYLLLESHSCIYQTFLSRQFDYSLLKVTNGTFSGDLSPILSFQREGIILSVFRY